MKKIIFLLCFLFCISWLNAQNNTSVLANGDWFTFAVDTTGIYKIDRSFLQNLGISVNGLDPKKIKLYGNGGGMLPERNADFRYEDLQENAIYIKGEEDGSFDSNDYLLFYAKGPDDFITEVATESITHRNNLYSDKAYYYITIGDSNGKRIQNKNQNQFLGQTTLTSYDDLVYFEQDEVNLFAAGTQWFYGEDFNITTSQEFVLPFPNALNNSEMQISFRGVSNSVVSSSLEVSVNGSNTFALNFQAVNPNSLTKATTTLRSATFTNSTDEISCLITYNNNGNPSANTFLDYIAIQGKKSLRFADFPFTFRSFEQAKSSSDVQFDIENATAISQVWDVTDPINIEAIQNQSTGNLFTFFSEGGVLKEFVVFGEANLLRPEILTNSRVANQNLRALNDVEYLIITAENLVSQAQRLADYHAKNSSLNTRVVVLSEIYNEFSSGSPDITGIRDFIRHIYTRNSAERSLKYVCFFGDSSYDYKDRIAGNNNIVPVKLSDQSFNLALSFVTDDYYVMLEENEGAMASNHTLDVVSSRIPVSTIQEAQLVVDKILSVYSKEALGDWRNNITLLADDIDVSSDIAIQQGVESIADEINQNKPIFNVSKIYTDAFVQENAAGGERYPEVNRAVSNAIERGTLIFDYFGHGGEDGFAAERILDVPQIQDLNHPNTLPLLITVTCEFARFDNPNRITAGELTFKNSNGGAANMITTTREIFISTGQRFNEDLIRSLLAFQGEDFTIAEALTRTKNNFSGTQKYFIYHFGDPAMRLAIPKPKVEITAMNGVPITQSIDTLKALSRVQFEGVVLNENNELLSDFNGRLSTTIFDKTSEKSTLNNDGFDVELKFDSQDSKLFTGQSTVENGRFQFDFIVPKDIRIAFGKGKLSFYAEDGISDRAGANFDIVVGGIDENAPDDTVGPEIRLFLNDESFVNGGNTNSSPNLIAELSDASGINTSITAVDHDIVAILDGDTANPIVLNDFYETELNDFTQGKVNYKLRDLEVGAHTLSLKAWDTYNNSSETTLEFVVVSDAELNLENVLNYPNPFVNYTEFWFQHNKPNEPLEVQVQVFTVSGKLVKTINQMVQTTGNLARSISWNGLDDFGNKIGKGVYVYRLEVKSTLSNLVAEHYEKLVILQ